MDLASTNDYTVVTVLDVTSPVVAVQVYLDRFTNIGWRPQLDRIAEVVLRYNPDLVQVDRTGLGDMPFVELAQALPGANVWGIAFNHGNKLEMVQALMLAFERGKIHVLPDPAQKAELKGYEAHRRPTGTFSYSAPAGRHDDCVVALMLAYAAVDEQTWGIVDLRS